MNIGIGRFQREGSGLAGSLNALGLRLEARFERRDKGANYAILGPDNCEIGAAWLKTGDFGDYLSVQLDSPTLPSPIYATMKMTATADGFYVLRWQRRDAHRANEPRKHGGGDNGVA
jgi:uncharacterized protein (DUF736 family)